MILTITLIAAVITKTSIAAVIKITLSVYFHPQLTHSHHSLITLVIGYWTRVNNNNSISINSIFTIIDWKIQIIIETLIISIINMFVPRVSWRGQCVTRIMIILARTVTISIEIISRTIILNPTLSYPLFLNSTD